ncbi:MAG: diguanylate cyclase [Lachnospiraceae bacterium]|nr:diguanylate cyclase [Lachnospiraceae bacterium]
MNSIRTKLIILISGAIIGVFILLASMATYSMGNAVKEDAYSMIRLLSTEKCRELNTHFEVTEHAVETLEDFVEKNADTERLAVDAEYTEQFIEEVRIRALDAARVTGNVETVYYRADPVKYADTGIFLTSTGNGEYISNELTNPLDYDKNDREHVSWYYEPIDSGRAIWLEPYFNKNINVYMISYVAPVYSGSKLLGVVGMDINMSEIHSVVNSVDYCNGFGFLLGEHENIIYHKEYPEGLSTILMDDDLKNAADYFSKTAADNYTVKSYKWRGEQHSLVTGNLENEMIFAISVPYKEIMHTRHSMQNNLILILFIALLAVLLLSYRIMTKVASPIRELTDAATHLAKGELAITIEHHSKDEIGQLADSIRSMQKELREYITYVHEQAYTDAMTGVGNKTAYLEMVKRINRKIEEKLADFAVVVFDINGLKKINDDHGHEYGDMLITDSAELIKNVFGVENVYRIGGDEFIVVMERKNKADINAYMQKMTIALENFNASSKKYSWPLAISKGAAVYIQDSDNAYREVFKRADEQMYQDKAAYYQKTGDRRRRS